MKLSEIKGAINKAIKSEINIDIMSNDVKEGYNSPSFFVTFTKSTKSIESQMMYKRSLSVRIHYFPKEKVNNSIEFMDMQDKLEDIFALTIHIKDRIITIGEVDTLINDNVLLFDFDIEFYEGYEDSQSLDYELMQSLAIKTKST